MCWLVRTDRAPSTFGFVTYHILNQLDEPMFHPPDYIHHVIQLEFNKVIVNAINAIEIGYTSEHSRLSWVDMMTTSCTVDCIMTKVHSVMHLLCSALFEIYHMSLAGAVHLGRCHRSLNLLKIPICSNFSVLHATPCTCLPVAGHTSQKWICLI